MQAIFQYEQNSSTTPEHIRTFVAEQLNFPELEEFCMALVDGILGHHAKIDQLLTRAATNWKLERMATVDRAILRLGAYEMAFAQNPPPPRVVITEAVEIAKRFSTFESSRFVNGVLDRISRLLVADNPPPSESPERTDEESTVSLNPEHLSQDIPLPTDLPDAEDHDSHDSNSNGRSDP